MLLLDKITCSTLMYLNLNKQPKGTALIKLNTFKINYSQMLDFKKATKLQRFCKG